MKSGSTLVSKRRRRRKRHPFSNSSERERERENVGEGEKNDSDDAKFVAVVRSFRLGRPDARSVRQAQSLATTGKQESYFRLTGDMFSDYREEHAAVSGERVRGDDGVVDERRR